MNGSNWQIDASCPQCGAPVLLEESDHIIACPFCRTRLYIGTDGLARYCLSPPPHVGGEVIYIPYRRTRGMVFNLAGGEPHPRYVDSNIRAVNIDGLPMTIGIRPQAMHLRFLTAAGGTIVPVDDTPAISSAPRPITRPPYPDAFIGETVSIIYNPFYRQGEELHDAFLRRPVMAWADIRERVLDATDFVSGVHFLALQCPRCGWDLEGEKTTLVLTCANCLSAWSCGDGGLRSVPFALWEGGAATALYLPFWRLRVEVTGVHLSSLADLVRLANLPRAVTAALESRPLHFWIPAFKINPSLFIRWARQMTVFQPEGDAATSISGRPLQPVTLPPEEALKAVLVTLAAVMADKQALMNILKDLRIRLGEALLVYHSFVKRNRELVHEQMGVTMDTQALGFGKQL